MTQYMKFPLNKNLSMEEIQAVSFEILKTIKTICEKEGFKYSLAFGTLIGAIRHKGYIPWDDDVDIIMPRPDFEKLMVYFQEHANELQPYEAWNSSKHPDYPYTMTRIIDNRYILDVDNEKPCGMGIFVDIYVLDGAGNSIEEARNLLMKTKKYPSSIFLSTRKTLKHGGTKGILKNILKPFFFVYVKLMGKQYFVNKLYRIISKYNYSSCSHLACLEWDNTTASATAKIDIENPVEVEFNGERFCATANYDKYLTHAYGDYMTPPPKKDRVYHHLYKAYKKEDCI